MGMAASQARLLTLTARLSDNELRSQTINNAKMRLATESSQASENYINALNNATLKFTNYDETGAALTQPLTYNSLMAYSSYNTQYGLVNSSGQILVSEAEAKMFKDANGDLNKYLKAHGLEYTTTYFKEAGGIENSDYPAPFNNVSSDTLQQWYEEYGSYENSVEVENYNKAYSNYISAQNTLSKSLDKTLEKYFTASGASEAGFITTNDFNALKNAYQYSTNEYSYNNDLTMKPDGFVNENAKTVMKNLLETYSQIYPGGNLTISNNNVSPTASKDAEDKDINVYTMDDLEITVDADGNVVSVTNIDAKDWSSEDAYDDTNKYYYTSSDTKTELVLNPSSPTWTPTSTTSLSTFLRNFSIELNSKDEAGNETLIGTITANKNSDNSINIKTNYSDSKTIKEELKYLNNKLLEILTENTDYTKFGEMILKDKFTPKIKKDELSGKLGESVTKCIDNKKAFLETIFGKEYETKQYQFAKKEIDTDGNVVKNSDGTDKINHTTSKTIIEAINDGDILMDSLTNEEFVLWLAKNSKDASGNELTEETSFMSENFKTVIKTFIIENALIAEYGTPKYAWIDEMDTQNTGNADSKAQWYTNLYKRMEKGYKTLENGLASSQQWIEYALETGLVTMEQVDKSYNWQSLEYKTCTKITEVTDDAAVAKAEAEYNRAMNDIKTKDNMYDVQLKNIDTEHTSLQTEYDSIKQVITKNIDRTFKFDQSA